MGAARFVMVMLGVTSMAASDPGAQAGEPPSATVSLKIPAQPLDDALIEFAEQTGLRVYFYAEALDGILSPGLSGTFSPRTALDRLLANTPLEYEFVEPRMVLIRVRSARPKDEGNGEKTSRQAAQEVVVTGTRIPGIAPVGSSVLIYTQKDFDRAGAATAQQFLATLTPNFGAGYNDDTVARTPTTPNDDVFGSTINLRGLGPGSTLVLVDGRRQALSGDAEYVDVSMIPLSAVERVEIFSDGASAIYGSDAIAGVVNFVLKKEYRGPQTRAQLGATSDGGGEEVLLAQSLGTSWESGSALLNYEYHHRDPILTSQRDYLKDAPPGPVIAEQDRQSVFLSAYQNLSEDLQLFSSFSYSHRQSDYAFFQTVFSELAPEKSENQQYGGSLGLGFDWGRSWQGEIIGNASRNTRDAVFSFPSIGFFTEVRSDYDIRAVDANLNGELFSLPAGPVKVAVGAGYREEDFERSGGFGGSFNIDSVFAESMIPLLSPSTVESTLPRLVLSVAGRYERYSSFGETSNPKIGLRWAPSTAVQLRASYGTAFKAPTQFQLDTSHNSVALLTVLDPQSPTGRRRVITLNGFNRDLEEETAVTWTAGLDFTPQSLPGFRGQLTYFDIQYEGRIEAVIATPISMFYDDSYAGLRIRRSDTGDADFDADVMAILTNPRGYRIQGCPAAFGGPITTGSCLEPAANFSGILDRRLRNVVVTEENGVDLTLTQTIDSSAGLFDLNLSATYLLGLTRRFTPLAPEISLLNTAFQPVDLRMRGSVGWSRGAWDITGTINYLDRYMDVSVNPQAGISSWTTLDLNFHYDLGKHFRSGVLQDTGLFLHLNNLFNRDPPFVADGTGFNYDTTNADPYGRTISLILTKHW